MSANARSGRERPSAQREGSPPARSAAATWPRKVVIAPDSFKGSLSAPQVVDAIARGMRKALPHAVLVACPLADGGEGTLDAILSRGGERRRIAVAGAGGVRIDADYGVIEHGSARAGIVEVAQVVGITDAANTAAPVEQRSTIGVGETILHALDAGATSLMIGLGGSSTNDGGAGLLVGLGARLLDRDDRSLPPTPAGLASIARVDVAALDPRIRATPITIMSDVNNPLCGPRGATAIFGPQKGVRPDRIAVLDERLAAFAVAAERALGRKARENAGAGAAGGLGFILQALGGEFRSGAEVVAELVQLDVALADADLLITGEGRTDSQTLLGKTPFVAARHAMASGIPAVLLSGAVDRGSLPLLAEAFTACFSLTFGPATLEQCIADADGLLADAGEQLARFAAAVVRAA